MEHAHAGPGRPSSCSAASRARWWTRASVTACSTHCCGALAAHGRRFEIIEDAREEPKTYHYVLKGALAVGRWISGRTERGENVGVLLPNVIPTVCTIFGLMAFGRVPAMLNYTAGPVAARSACAAARVRTVIASRAFIEQAKLAPLVAALDELNIVYLEDIRREFGWADKLWLLTFALWFPRLATPRAHADDPGVVVFTSGSEARPKGVVLSHDNIIANYRQMATVMDFTPADRILNALPLYHTYSFTAGLMLCLLSGTRLFLYVSPLRYRAIAEIAYRRDVTGLYGTSTFLSYYARHANPLDFHTVRYVISGGEKLGEDVARLYLEKFGLRVYEGYGATECAPVIALSTPQCYRIGTVGRVLPGIEYRVEKIHGIVHGGVLHLKGPSVMLGYYRFSQSRRDRAAALGVRRRVVLQRRRGGPRRGRRGEGGRAAGALRQDRGRDGVAGRGRAHCAVRLARPAACGGRARRICERRDYRAVHHRPER